MHAPKLNARRAAQLWLQDRVVALGARTLASLSPAWRLRLAEQMAAHWLRPDAVFAHVVHGNLRLALPQWEPAARQTVAARNAWLTALAQIDHFRAWYGSVDRLRTQVQLDGEALLHKQPPAVVLATHQLGFEVAALRMAQELEGAVVVDPGAWPLPPAARAAWSRSRPQLLLDVQGGPQPMRQALRQGRSLLLLCDEPPAMARPCSARVLGFAQRFSPLGAVLARAEHARLIGVDVRIQNEHGYRVQLQELPAPRGAADTRWLQSLANTLNGALHEEPAGYWWGRQPIVPAASPSTRMRNAQQISAKVEETAAGQASSRC